MRGSVAFFVTCTALAACQSKPPTSSDAVLASPSALALSAARTPATLRAAELSRNESAIPSALDQDPLVETRRDVARALARIADPQSVVRLLERIGDADPEVATWAAYGIGFACKDAPDVARDQLVARALGLPKSTPPSLRTELARAIGRCGGSGTETFLRNWLTFGGQEERSAAVAGLGDLAQKSKELESVTINALATNGHPDALFPLTRLAKIEPAAWPRIITAAKTVLSSRAANDPSRIFAVRALAKVEAWEALAVVALSSVNLGERVEAIRAIAKAGSAEQNRELLGRLLAEQKEWSTDLPSATRTGRFHPLLAWLLTRKSPAPEERALLTPLLSFKPEAASRFTKRRLSHLRCGAAALLLAPTDARFDVCSEEGDESIRDRAKLSALDSAPIRGERLRLFSGIAKGGPLRARERAIELFADHPELDEVGRQIVSLALKSDPIGLVATAADLLASHPALAAVLATSEKKKALDPKSPLPEVGSDPKREVDPQILAALDAALARPLPDDAIEARAALVDAAIALRSKNAKAAALKMCGSTNATLRARGGKALVALGIKEACPKGSRPQEKARSLSDKANAPFKLKLGTEIGDFTLSFDEPHTEVHRDQFLRLVERGFFRGITFHRVVPAFVVQFGDPGGDGYGGSGDWLPCETGLRSFTKGTIGMALAGRDTGSSQLFVTLETSRHLDGQYTAIGSATGPWEALVEEDTIDSASIE